MAYHFKKANMFYKIKLYFYRCKSYYNLFKYKQSIKKEYLIEDALEIVDYSNYFEHNSGYREFSFFSDKQKLKYQEDIKFKERYKIFYSKLYTINNTRYSSIEKYNQARESIEREFHFSNWKLVFKYKPFKPACILNKLLNNICFSLQYYLNRNKKY